MRRLAAILTSLRPRQWVKNLFVFAGLIFAQKLFTPLVWPALAAFVLFCALSGAIYLLNDVADRERDRLHPRKRDRPIACDGVRAHLQYRCAASAQAEREHRADRSAAGDQYVGDTPVSHFPPVPQDRTRISAWPW